MGAPRKQITAPRVVLDTNVALSALVFGKGRLSWLREDWQSRRVIPLISRATAEEMITVLAYPKFKLSAEEREDLLADYLPYCETVAVPIPPPAAPECRDARDMPFLWLALAGKADYLVTGDDDLLSLANHCVIPIMAADDLRQKLAG